MQIRQKPNQLKNYEGHLHVHAMTRAMQVPRSTLILYNNGYYNPQGTWITYTAVKRWAQRYLLSEQAIRFNGWLSATEATASAYHVSKK